MPTSLATPEVKSCTATPNTRIRVQSPTPSYSLPSKPLVSLPPHSFLLVNLRSKSFGFVLLQNGPGNDTTIGSYELQIDYGPHMDELDVATPHAAVVRNEVPNFPTQVGAD